MGRFCFYCNQITQFCRSYPWRHPCIFPLLAIYLAMLYCSLHLQRATENSTTETMQDHQSAGNVLISIWKKQNLLLCRNVRQQKLMNPIDQRNLFHIKSFTLSYFILQTDAEALYESDNQFRK